MWPCRSTGVDLRRSSAKWWEKIYKPISLLSQLSFLSENAFSFCIGNISECFLTLNNEYFSPSQSPFWLPTVSVRMAKAGDALARLPVRSASSSSSSSPSYFHYNPRVLGLHKSEIVSKDHHHHAFHHHNHHHHHVFHDHDHHHVCVDPHRFGNNPHLFDSSHRDGLHRRDRNGPPGCPEVCCGELINLTDLINFTHLVNLTNLTNLTILTNLINLTNLTNLTNLINLINSRSRSKLYSLSRTLSEQPVTAMTASAGWWSLLAWDAPPHRISEINCFKFWNKFLFFDIVSLTLLDKIQIVPVLKKKNLHQNAIKLQRQQYRNSPYRQLSYIGVQSILICLT